MILPSDFPHRFFNPLTSKHREDYIHVLLSLESVLEQAKRMDGYGLKSHVISSDWNLKFSNQKRSPPRIGPWPNAWWAFSV